MFNGLSSSAYTLLYSTCLMKFQHHKRIELQNLEEA